MNVGDGLDDCGLLVGSKAFWRIGANIDILRVYFPRSRPRPLGRREAEQVTKFRKIVIILGENFCTTTILTAYINSVQYKSHKKHTNSELVHSMPA